MVEIVNYEPVNKNKTIGYVDIKIPILKPTTLLFRRIAHLQSGDKKWFNFPGKEYESEGKKKFYQQVALINRSHSDEFNRSVLAALSNFFDKNPTLSPYQKEPPKQMDLFQDSELPF